MTHSAKPRAIVTTVPFGDIDATPIRRLTEEGVEFTVNPLGRRLKAEEVAGVIAGYEIVIAGTEPITAQIMRDSPNLRAICRVGIGLDSVDLLEARARGIAVSYTPDGPSPAVAELTIGLIIDCLRGVSAADRMIRAGRWHRSAGRRISESVIGVIGIGRIGGRVIRHLAGGFPGVRILANDLEAKPGFEDLPNLAWVDKQTIYREADVVTLHLPATAETIGMISEAELASMKKGAVLVNTARGGIVDEAALLAALSTGPLGAAAIDTFVDEPYAGPLAGSGNAVLTCHLGSMTADCRARMEIEATEEAIRFAKGMAFASPVPEAEYRLAEQLRAARG